MPKEGREQVVTFSDREKEMVQMVANMHGISFDEAATQLAKGAIARSVKRTLGHRQAKVIQIKGKP